METLPPSLQAAQKRRLAVQDALADLEGRLAAASGSTGWRTAVGAALLGLRGAFVAHVEAVEGDGGLLAEVVDDAPRLGAAVDRLERDHVEIVEQIDGLANALAAADVSSIRELGVELMRSVVRHRQRGSDLIYEAYNTDIGGQSGA